MARVIINYSVDEQTKARIEDLARDTHRSQGYVLDWIVEEAWIKARTSGDGILNIVPETINKD